MRISSIPELCKSQAWTKNMNNISINGVMIADVQMPLEPHTEGVVSYLRYTENRLHYQVAENAILLHIPAFLCIQLYRESIPPIDAAQSVDVRIGKEVCGLYTIADFRYPNDIGNEYVRIRFDAVP